MSASSQSYPIDNDPTALTSPIIARFKLDLASAKTPTERDEVKSNFWKSNKFPLIERIANDEKNLQYTFIFQGDPKPNDPQDIYLVGDHRWGSPKKVTDNELLRNVEGTDVNFVTMVFPADARFRYSFLKVSQDEIKKIYRARDTDFEKLQGSRAKFMFYGDVSELVEEKRVIDPLNVRKPSDAKDNEYDLELMSSLPDNDPNKAVKNKIYLSSDGKYVVRDPNGIVRKGDFEKDLIKKADFADNLKDEQFVHAILDITSKAGYTHNKYSLLVGPKASKPINETAARIDPLRLKKHDIQVPLHADYNICFDSCKSDELKERIAEWKTHNAEKKEILVIENSDKKEWTAISNLAEISLSGQLLEKLKLQKNPVPEQEIKDFLDHHHYWIYLPINHDYKRKEPYPLHIFLDGKQYIEEMHAPEILDSMTNEKKVPPGVAVFLAAPEDGSFRYNTYHTNDEFSHFVAKQFIPALINQPHLNISSTCDLTGFSMSALAATYIGLKYPEVIKHVISQSGAFWTDPQGCSLLIMEKIPKNLKDIPGTSSAAFVFGKNELFYVDKVKNRTIPIPLMPGKFEFLMQELGLKPLAEKEEFILKYDVLPMQLLPLFSAVTKHAPKYKMMDAIEAYTRKNMATEFILQAGTFEGPVSTKGGVTTSDNEPDSLLVSNIALLNILKNNGVNVSFSTAPNTHTSDGCEATLARPLEMISVKPQVMPLSLSSTSIIYKSGSMMYSPDVSSTLVQVAVDPVMPHSKSISTPASPEEQTDNKNMEEGGKKFTPGFGS